MKISLSLGLALCALATSQAQIFRPQTVNGALLGGIAGAVIGNNSGDLHHNAWKGAAIGAGAGALLGSLGDANVVRDSRSRGAYVYRDSPVIYAGYNRGYRGGRGYSVGFYGAGPRYGYGGYGEYGYDGSGSYAAEGLFLGGLAGGIIGNNSGSFRHNGWRGAAWGAGIGWLLGTIADANRRPVYEQSPVVVQQPAVAAPAAPAQPTTIINNYYNAPATPMSSANTLFGRN